MENNFSETAKRFKILNEMAVKEEIAVFGSDYLSDFPFYDLMQGRVTDYVVYNRSMKGLTVCQATEIVDDALKHLNPRIILVSFGENEPMDDKFFEDYARLLKHMALSYKNSKICLLQKLPEDKAIAERLERTAKIAGAAYLYVDSTTNGTGAVFGRLSSFFRGGKISFADAFCGR